MKHFERLYDKALTGKIKFWEINVFELGTNRAEIRTKHGVVGGKTNRVLKVVDKGKNLGKVNSTTPFEQACKDALSKWNKKVDNGYVSQMSQIGKKPSYLPMLAQTFYSLTCPDVVKKKVKPTKVVLPLIAQPKLNGVRAIVRRSKGEVFITSKKGKDYTKICSKLAWHLRGNMLDDDIWDGEIYVHGWTFQRILRAVKKYRTDTRKLQFHRYDICDEDHEFHERAYELKTLNRTRYCKHVTTTTLINYDQIKTYHDIFVNQGYEGVILRDPDAYYIFKHRVKGLLKYKEFMDAEFKIVSYQGYLQQDTNMKGKRIMRKCIRFICEYRNTKHKIDTFEVVPRGTLKQREQMYKKGKTYINKDITVRFQEYTEDGAPQFPVGIAIRDYE